MTSSPAPPLSASAVATTASATPIRRHLIAVDAYISENLHSFAQNYFPRIFLLILELSADFRFFFPVFLSLFLTKSSIALRRSFLFPLLLGLLLDLAVVGLIKIIVRRSRPVYNKNMSVAVSVDHYSFPSGHSTRVCFIAAFVYLSAAAIEEAVLRLGGEFSRFVDRRIGPDHAKATSFVVLIVSAWAAVTSVSRVLLGRHFVTDVLAGACLGVFEALFVFHYLRF